MLFALESQAPSPNKVSARPRGGGGVVGDVVLEGSRLLSARVRYMTMLSKNACEYLKGACLWSHCVIPEERWV